MHQVNPEVHERVEALSPTVRLFEAAITSETLPASQGKGVGA
jgi:hypothetical protein